MKVGTKFKLECVVAESNAFLGGTVVRSGGVDLCSLEVLEQHSMHEISDIREPRRRFTDVDGTEYEVLVDGDMWKEGDMLHNGKSGVREKASFCIGSKVFVGPNYKIGLRKVKA